MVPVQCRLTLVIGGMGTIYAAAIGAAIFVVAQNYLLDLLALGNKAAASLPAFAALLSPDRWLLWLGLLCLSCPFTSSQPRTYRY